MNPTTVNIVSSLLFGLAVIHTFSTKFFERLAHQQPKHAGIWHLLGEIEAVFGFWALVLVVCMFALEGSKTAIEYVDTRNFTEPLFVFAIMVVAGTKPILQFAMKILTGGSGAATAYLKSSSEAQLQQLFMPEVKKALDEVALSKTWTPVVNKINQNKKTSLFHWKRNVFFIL